VLVKVFSGLNPENFTCSTIIDGPLWMEIVDLMIFYFKDIAVSGWQFERFEDAWCLWLKENATIDWTEERLHDNVEAILKANLGTDISSSKSDTCACASQVINTFGTSFYNWMSHNLEAGRELNGFSAFHPPKIQLCPGIPYKPGTEQKVGDFLLHKYEFYKRVSFSLWKVVHLRSRLKNSYPGATLHDCDDGSDQNPVRLGSSALGNYPVKRNVTL
jgi:hypothetical protein